MNYFENEREKYEKGKKTHSLSKTKYSSSQLNVDTLVLRSGVRLQVEKLPEAILDKIELFYCCATCGKIFWEGGHFSRVCTQFSEILNNTESFYAANREKIS